MGKLKLHQLKLLVNSRNVMITQVSTNTKDDMLSTGLSAIFSWEFLSSENDLSIQNGPDLWSLDLSLPVFEVIVAEVMS